MLNTDKIHIQHLAEICFQKGVTQVVLSPGSRCAPLVITFNRHPKIKCYTMVDERSAAFFALGIAQQSQKPVALICTSGSAVLNYAPAIAEAFYQKIPLILLTADRPNEWIDQGENQSIQQFEVFKNYVKKSYQLPLNTSNETELFYSNRLVSEAINISLFPDFGPVHINIPLREPLYNLIEEKMVQPKIIEQVESQNYISDYELSTLRKVFNNSNKTLMVIGGQKSKNKNIEQIIQQFSTDKNVVILKESISNIDDENSFGQIDPFIEYITKNKLKEFVPDLLITFGNGIVSKKLKFWLREQEIKEHWHISKSNEHWDNFLSLTKVISADIDYLLSSFLNEKNFNEEYYNLWKELKLKVEKKTEYYLSEAGFSDFVVFHKLIQSFPKNSNIHFGNSTPVRYANLLKIPHGIQVNANRGVSGIDGQVSTALGASNFNDKLTLCITGDLAMMYDSNGLWNNYLHPNFKIVLINNNGGNIFRIIPGPDNLEELETYFETKNNYNAEHLANLHGLDYLKVEKMENISSQLELFYNNNDKSVILEIKTDGEVSASILKDYFKYIAQ